MYFLWAWSHRNIALLEPTSTCRSADEGRSELEWGISVFKVEEHRHCANGETAWEGHPCVHYSGFVSAATSNFVNVNEGRFVCQLFVDSNDTNEDTDTGSATFCEVLPSMLNLSSLSPPEWCNSGAQRRANASACEAAYVAARSGIYYRPCVHVAARSSCYTGRFSVPSSVPRVSSATTIQHVAGGGRAAVPAREKGVFRFVY